jgi:hypothetical protein
MVLVINCGDSPYGRTCSNGVKTPIDQQERKTYDFDGDETKTGSARMVVYVGAI